MRDPGEKAGKPCKVLVWGSPVPDIFQANDHTFLKKKAMPAIFTMALAQLPGFIPLLKVMGQKESLMSAFNK